MGKAQEAAYAFCEAHRAIAKGEAARLLKEESCRLGPDGKQFDLASTQLEQGDASCATTYAWISCLQGWLPEGDGTRKKIAASMQDAIAWEVVQHMHGGDDLDAALMFVLSSTPVLHDIATLSRLKHACFKITRHLCAIGWLLQSFRCTSRNDCRPKRRLTKAKLRSDGPEVSPTEDASKSPQDEPNQEGPAREEGPEGGPGRSVSECASEAEGHMDSVSVKEAPATSTAGSQPGGDACGEQTANMNTNIMDAQTDVTASALLYPSCSTDGNLRLQWPPGLALTECCTHPIAKLLEEAYDDLKALLPDASDIGHVGRKFQHRNLEKRSLQWCDRASQFCDEDTKTAATQWIRNGTACELQRRMLVLAIVLGEDHVLSLIENSARPDDLLSRAVYGAMHDYCAVYGFNEEHAQKLVDRLLSHRLTPHESDVYVAYMDLLGQLLQGTARLDSDTWAHASVGHLGPCERTISTVIDIAGWWHRSRFHEEKTAALLEQAFATLLCIFEGCDSLGRWELDICRLARWCIYNYHHIATALEFAKKLVQMGGRLHQ